MKCDFDYVIVGGGVMGCATLLSLSTRSSATLLLEQRTIANTSGSSRGNSRNFRLAYEEPLYIKLGYAALDLWRSIETEASTSFFTAVGGLDLGLPCNPLLLARARALEESGVDFTRLNPTELNRWFPQLQLPEGTTAIYQPEAGLFDVKEVLRAFVGIAKANGTEVRQGESALRIIPCDGYVRVETSVATYSTRKVVIAAGPWANDILQTLGVSLPLRVTLEQYTFFHPAERALFAPDRFPVIAHHHSGNGGTATGYYAFPMFAGDGVKLGERNGGPSRLPQNGPGDPDPKRRERDIAYARQIIPMLGDSVGETETGFYTNTPDGHFVVDVLPSDPRIVIGAGFSGHGFKFASLIGEMLADLAENGRSRYPRDLFRITRF